MRDIIDRQAALSAVGFAMADSPSITREDWNAIFDALGGVPSAQPERKKGEWVVRDNPGTGWYRVTCSECGEDVTSTAPVIGFFPDAKVQWDYCPYCGARMEVSE